MVRRISRKQAEIVTIEQQIAAFTQQRDIAKAYLQAMEDTLRMIDREAVAPETGGRALRKGGAPAKAEKALQGVGRQLHITKLLPAMGLAVNRKTRSAVSSALSAYARRRDVFTRPAPNTFGLIEWEDANNKDEGSRGEADRGDGKANEEGPLMRLAR